MLWVGHSSSDDMRMSLRKDPSPLECLLSLWVGGKEECVHMYHTEYFRSLVYFQGHCAQKKFVLNFIRIAIRLVSLIN